METSLITEIATQVPSLIVMAYIVVIFLKRIKESEQFFRDLQKESNAVIIENTKTNGEIIQVIRKCTRNGNKSK